MIGRSFAVLRFVLPFALALPLAQAGSKEQKELLEFAMKMAKSGNWREARYRWEKASREDPDNPFLLNNIAVALEALGEREEAARRYAEAARLSGGNSDVGENARRLAMIESTTGVEGAASLPTTVEGDTAGAKSKKEKGRKAVRVQILVPMPPKLDLVDVETLLVTSFRAEERDTVDAGREMVRFLRSEFRRETDLRVLDVEPPPAVPEQRIEELIANHEFWKYLGKEHGADLIVSGLVTFDRRDVSGFRDVDTISTVTGQKVRTTQFVEMEEFTYEVDLLFFDGPTGGLRFRDHLSRSATYQGLGNDPLTAFFGMSEEIAGDVLSVVTSRAREEQRVIFQG